MVIRFPIQPCRSFPRVELVLTKQACLFSLETSFLLISGDTATALTEHV